MLKTLVKKQIEEIFRNYFYDQKKNKMRPKSAIILYFVMFFILIFGILGFIFGSLAVSVCNVMHALDLDWFYFLLFTGLSIFLGAFGSIFNTFSVLYLAKDNDHLLSMPIPEKYIVGSRLISVYLLGTMYAASVMLPALIIYWVSTPFSIVKIICDIILFLCITGIVLVISCLLGWCVAKISLKLKNKTFVRVAVALLLVGAYYFFYFRLSSAAADFLVKAELIGSKIKGNAFILYKIGQIGEGNVIATLIFLAATLAIIAVTWFVLNKTFISIATESGSISKTKNRKIKSSKKSVFGALLSKEFARFTGSAAYMLNCGLGLLMIPIVGVVLIVKGPEIADSFSKLFVELPGGALLVLCTVLFSLASMIDVAAPSVSLEGKTLWVIKSLPIDLKTVFRAKISMHFILAVIPMLFTAICGICVFDAGILEKALVIILTILFALFSAVFSMFLGIKMPYMVWTNEIYPIKQSGAVFVALFGSWGITLAFALCFFLFAYRIGVALYLGIWALIVAVAILLLYRYVMTSGVKTLTEL